MKKNYVTLSEREKVLLRPHQKGELPAKVYRRAISLLEMNKGKTYTDVVKILG